MTKNGTLQKKIHSKKKNGACEKVRHPPAKRKKIHQRLGPAVTRSTGCQKYDPGHSQGVNAHPTHLKKIVTTFFTTCEAVKPPTLGKSLTELQKDNTKAARHPTSPPERVWGAKSRSAPFRAGDLAPNTGEGCAIFFAFEMRSLGETRPFASNPGFQAAFCRKL